MAAKPSSKPDWTVGNPSIGTVTVEPSAGKKQTGWQSAEKPGYQYMNWLFWNITQWINWVSDLVSYQNFVVHADGSGDYATIAAAITAMPAEGGVILLIGEFNIASAITVDKPIKFIGRGTSATILNLDATMLVTADNVSFQDIAFISSDNLDICSVTGNFTSFMKCKFTVSNASTCISFSGDGSHVTQCQFEGVVAPSTGTGIDYELGSIDNSDAFNVFSV
jgi:hypothetical protein